MSEARASPRKRASCTAPDPPDSKDGAIALQPVSASSDGRLPTFDESEFEIVLRRQRSRHAAQAKSLQTPSRFSTARLDAMWEFAGWGSTSTLSITDQNVRHARDAIESERNATPRLDHFVAASIVANGVFGSVFYSLPAAVAVAGALSPVSLLIATMLIWFVRPVMEELASALPIGGSAYAYLLNSTGKTYALLGAAFQVLDYCMNSLQASASAAAYVAGEADLPFKDYWLTVVFLVACALFSLLGVKESSMVAFTITAFHMLTMAALMIASTVAWARTGNDVLRANWSDAFRATSSTRISRDIFDGICLGLLAVTGFECAPEYAPICRPGQYPKVLRDLQVGAILLNAPLMLFALALIPTSTLLGGFNVLSLLAEEAVGRWFRHWIVVDAMLVLCAGILTGGLSACSLLDRLALDRALPTFLLHKLPVTRAPWMIQVVFTALCIAIYASTGASVQIIGKIFSISFLCVLMLFPISVIMLKHNRGRLPRDRHAPLVLVAFCILLLLTIFGGNVAIDPMTLGYFAPYAAGLSVVFLLLKHRLSVLRIAYWIHDQSPWLQRQRWTRTWGPRLVLAMRRLRRQPVLCFVKTDEINILLRFVHYVQQNEPTANLKFVHVYEVTDKVPCDFEAFSQILDEAFPSITIDLVFVSGRFDEATVFAICHKLAVPRSFAFVSVFGPECPLTAAKLGGMRIVSM